MVLSWKPFKQLTLNAIVSCLKWYVKEWYVTWMNVTVELYFSLAIKSPYIP